jgi:hypothetical protein
MSAYGGGHGAADVRRAWSGGYKADMLGLLFTIHLTTFVRPRIVIADHLSSLLSKAANMAAYMPPIPRFFFGVVEPVMVASVGLSIFLNPSSHASSLEPPSTSTLPPLSPGSEMAIRHLGGNLMLIAAMIAIIMWCTGPDMRAARLTVLAMALADLPHWGGLILALKAWEKSGGSGLWESQTWTPALRQFMIAPAVTFTIKIAYLLGLFGKDRTQLSSTASQTSSDSRADQKIYRRKGPMTDRLGDIFSSL